MIMMFLPQPPISCERIFQHGWKRMLGRKAIVDNQKPFVVALACLDQTAALES
jgi:hypothetical protein